VWPDWERVLAVAGLFLISTAFHYMILDSSLGGQNIAKIQHLLKWLSKENSNYKTTHLKRNWIENYIFLIL
jgi:hypothetical protein